MSPKRTNVKKAQSKQNARRRPKASLHLFWLSIGIGLGLLLHYDLYGYRYHSLFPSREGNMTFCFSPNKARNQPQGFQTGCTQLVVDAIHQAEETIHIAMFSFTSEPIAQALRQAAKRGVQVQIILHHPIVGKRQTQIHNLPGSTIYLDKRPATHHNKYMVIDGKIVLTGSFNWSKNAEKSNRENLVKIYNQELAQKYLRNWESHRSADKVYERGKLS